VAATAVLYTNEDALILHICMTKNLSKIRIDVKGAVPEQL